MTDIRELRSQLASGSSLVIQYNKLDSTERFITCSWPSGVEEPIGDTDVYISVWNTAKSKWILVPIEGILDWRVLS